ncbi:MAG: hypothetical protein Q7R33_08035 [Nitrosarchaeum sp.]|nr:hypothetical protein [Nitrosarchaeum sp.]
MKYVLVIKIPFDKIDDPEARQAAQEYLKQFGLPEGCTVKLQRLQEKAEPIGVKIN